jgi:hypothetical protein
LNLKAAGWAGVLAGVGLIVEGAGWTISGWEADTFADPESALTFLADDGGTLRWAVLAGFTNLVFAVVFIAGLAAVLRGRTPTLASATLWFGMIGIVSHLLVPMAYWYGVPAFLDAAERDPEQAFDSWTSFAALVDAAGGAGNLFLGLSMATAGWAAISHKALPVLLGWLALLTGVLTVLTVFSPDTALSTIADAAFMPSLLLSIVFRVWAGMALLGRSKLV